MKGKKEQSSAERFLSRHRLRARDILYLCRENGRTVLHLEGGMTLETFHPVKELAEALPPDRFASVNKGTLVRRDAIAHEDGGILLLTDGTVLTVRRTDKATPVYETRETLTLRIDRRYGILFDHPTPHLLFALPLFDGEEGAVLRWRNSAAEGLDPDPLFAVAAAVLADGAPHTTDDFYLYSPEDGYCLAVQTHESLRTVEPEENSTKSLPTVP